MRIDTMILMLLIQVLYDDIVIVWLLFWIYVMHYLRLYLIIIIIAIDNICIRFHSGMNNIKLYVTKQV